MVIEQFLSGFHYGDAIGHSVLSLHDYLVSKGIESRIIAITIDDSLKKLAVPFDEYRETRGSVKIYHYAISSPMNNYFLESSGKNILIYHNITPSSYFEGFSPNLVRATSLGRKELSSFKDKFDLVIADSDFNSKELSELGFKNIRTFPVMISPDGYEGEYSGGYLELFRDGKKNILFVGRVTPNKKIEDLIKFISVYKKIVSFETRIIIAGNHNTVPEYFASLLKLKSELGLTISDLFFTGHIPFKELLAVYHCADIFLTLSEHEGFCLPLIESSFFKLPVVAYNAGAVEETLDGSGILINNKDMEKLSLLVEKVLNDKDLRNGLAAAAGSRVERYLRDSHPGKLLEMIVGEFND